MKASLFAPVSLLVAVSIVLAARAPVDDPTGDMTEVIARVDTVFERWDSPEAPGCAVAASHKGRPLFSRAYGMADLEHSAPNTPSTIFEAGSVSKQFVAAAVVLLSRDGELSLEDDIRGYVPELPDYGETITLRHLLTHTSGLRDWGSVAAISGWGRSNRSHDHDHVLDILSRQSALNFSPGERYSYSNSGYNLLAMVVERVSGRSLAEFSEEHLFEPLGMTSTEWRDDYTRIVKGRSSAYTAEDDSTFSINRPIEDVHGNGGLLTTTQDLLLWNDALENGALGGADVLEVMEEAGELNSGRTIAYALGVQHGTEHGAPVVSHTGATSGYRAYLARFPEQALSVALLCNVTNADPGDLGSQVAEILLGEEAHEEEESEPAEAAEVASDQLEAWTGRYKDSLDGTLTELVVEEGALKIKDGATLTPVSSSAFQVGSGDREFIFEESSAENRPAIQVIVDGYEEGTLVPVDDFEPNGEALEAFAGRYHSDDAETTLTVRVEDGELVAERRPGRTFELEPAYTDAFLADGLGLLRFDRNGSGEVTGLSLSLSRVFDMRFERMGG